MISSSLNPKLLQKNWFQLEMRLDKSQRGLRNFSNGAANSILQAILLNFITKNRIASMVSSFFCIFFVSLNKIRKKFYFINHYLAEITFLHQSFLKKLYTTYKILGNVYLNKTVENNCPLQLFIFFY